MTKSNTEIILDDAAIAEIEARPVVDTARLDIRGIRVLLIPDERDALIQTVRALRAQLYEEQLRNQTQAESIMELEADVTSLQSQLEEVTKERDSMRSRCVEKVKALRDKWQQKHDTLNTDTDLIDRLSLEGDIRVADKIMKELESFPIQEQEVKQS